MSQLSALSRSFVVAAGLATTLLACASSAPAPARATAFEPTPPLVFIGVGACENAADCELVVTGCCDLCNGSTLTGMSKAHLEAFPPAPVDCTSRPCTGVATCREMAATPACIDRTCGYTLPSHGVVRVQ